MTIALRAPREITNVTLHGKRIDCVDGLIHVAEEDISELTPYGFTLAEAPPLNGEQRSEILRLVAQEARIIAENWSNDELKAFLSASREGRVAALSAVKPPKNIGRIRRD